MVARHRLALYASVATAALAVLRAVPVAAQGQPLLREGCSRLVVLHVGGVQTPPAERVCSQEISLNVGGTPPVPYQRSSSREVALVVATPDLPAPVATLSADASAGGERVVLDWTGYNQWAEHDVVRYDIYVSDRPFTSVSGMTAFVSVPGETLSITLDSLEAWQDRYFAAVPVEADGGFVASVSCAAAYAVARETLSRSYALFVGESPTPPYRTAAARETSLVVAIPAVPSPVTCLAVETDATGRRAELDWSGYNQLAEYDVTGYRVYVSDQAFTNVQAMTPYVTLPGETFRLVIENLTPWLDHHFAVAPVDAQGGFDVTVESVGAYVVAREAVSRKLCLLVESGPASGHKGVFSRELSFVGADTNVPAPVCHAGSGFSARTSVSDYRAIDLDWSHYNEIAQRDVLRYRIYVAPVYFGDVNDMQPVAFVPAGTFEHTLTGLDEDGVYAVAVAAEDAMGQWNPILKSTYVVASPARVFEVCTRAWLLGPYGAATGKMRAAIGNHLPLVSPYQSVGVRVPSIDSGVVDWVWGTLIDTNGRPIASQSGWLREDGSVVSLGHTQMLWKVAEGTRCHFVLRHRNHLDAMSSVPIVFTNGFLTLDFSTSPDKVAGGTNACVELEPGVWGMIAGDCDGDGKITEVDREIVRQQAGKTGYLPGDCNLDGVVTEEDVP